MKIKLLYLVVCAFSTPLVAAGVGWQSSEDVDKMSSKKTVIAVATSDNLLAFSFPYTGENHGYIAVRQHPLEGTDVIISIDKGQMLCWPNDCSVKVKFDNGAIGVYRASAPIDRNRTMLFLNDKQRFISGAKKAKKILIQFNAYNQGSPVLEFSTPYGLTWPQK
jgi:hypothetical protein